MASKERAHFAIRVLAFVVVVAFTLSCTKSHPHSVTIRWQPAAQAKGIVVVGYNLYRSTTPGGPYVVIASRVPGTIYEDTIVNRGTTYFYVVTTLDSAGTESARSREIKVTVPYLEQR
jgi:fibronectin type 3 domain-containing protein